MLQIRIYTYVFFEVRESHQRDSDVMMRVRLPVRMGEQRIARHGEKRSQASETATIEPERDMDKTLQLQSSIQSKSLGRDQVVHCVLTHILQAENDLNVSWLGYANVRPTLQISSMTSRNHDRRALLLLLNGSILNI